MLEVEVHLHQKVGVGVVGVRLLEREGGRVEEVEQGELVGLRGQEEEQEEPSLWNEYSKYETEKGNSIPVLSCVHITSIWKK